MSFRSTIVLLLVLTSLAGCDRHNAATPQATASDSSPPAPSGASKEGPAGKLDRSHKGEAAQTAAFIDPAGKPVTLAAFKGKPVLVNMWATWCGPCVAEMPKLDQVAAHMTVVAVSQDL
ncbi:MAG: redoxin family protein [Sphingomonas sp.]